MCCWRQRARNGSSSACTSASPAAWANGDSAATHNRQAWTIEIALLRQDMQPRTYLRLRCPGPVVIARGVAVPIALLMAPHLHRAGLPVLGQALQLLGNGRQQTLARAFAYSTADLDGQPLRSSDLDGQPLDVIAHGLMLLRTQQITDIEQLQQPACALALQPTTGAHRALRHRRQLCAQRAAQVLHVTLLVQPELQADRRHARPSQRLAAAQPTFESAAHSCTLASACRRWGKRGTSPIIGSTSKGSTRVSLRFG